MTNSAGNGICICICGELVASLFTIVLNGNLFAHPDLLSWSYWSCQDDWQEVRLEPYYSMGELWQFCSICSKREAFSQGFLKLQFYVWWRFPAFAAVPVEINEGKTVSELSFINLALFVCFKETANQVRISSSCWDFKNCSVSCDLPRKTNEIGLCSCLCLYFCMKTMH